MELKEFIVKTVVDLHQSIEQIKIETGRVFYIGDPKNTNGTSNKGGKISFDVALGHTLEHETGGKIKAGVSVLGGEVDGTIKGLDSAASRIKFELTLKD